MGGGPIRYKALSIFFSINPASQHEISSTPGSFCLVVRDVKSGHQEASNPTASRSAEGNRCLSGHAKAFFQIC